MLLITLYCVWQPLSVSRVSWYLKWYLNCAKSCVNSEKCKQWCQQESFCSWRISLVRNNFSFAHENKYNGEKIWCPIDLSEKSFKDLIKRITTENPKCIIINIFFNSVFHWDNPDTYLNSLKIWNINCSNNYEDVWELPQSSIMISMKSPGPFSFLSVFQFTYIV